MRTWGWLTLATAIGGCPAPRFSGLPVLEVGTGQFAFEPVEEGQLVEIVSGPQGGCHVWFAIETRGLDPREVRLDSQLYADPIEVEPDDTAAAFGPVGEPFFFFVRLYEGDEEGTWVTAGLPHQVDRSEVRGKRHRLEVTATDRDGRSATSSMIIIPVREVPGG